ncbi:MAG: 30S ribosomal protein S18 [Anaerolineae bacterium]|nr:30S ribosomal protein S18 [Anaerolineae bacterium]
MTEERSSQNRSGGRRRFYTRPKFCQFCSDKEQVINYKNIELLKRYITDEGKIRPRRQTGACAKHQREVTRAIKRARHVALLPFTGKYWEEGGQL